MASVLATKRLRKEYLALQHEPMEHIIALPLDTNILEWHYVLRGSPDTPYEGGYYHGILRFPPEYPMKPPSVMMLTENGRFQTNKRLCLSMSDFHPETWNPMWSVSSILMGLYSFMNESKPTLGSIETSLAMKKKYAASSLESNCKNSLFIKCFPELVELHKKLEKEKEERIALSSASSSNYPGSTTITRNKNASNLQGKIKFLIQRLKTTQGLYITGFFLLLVSIVFYHL